jgi:hypothetical protein
LELTTGTVTLEVGLNRQHLGPAEAPATKKTATVTATSAEKGAQNGMNWNGDSL